MTDGSPGGHLPSGPRRRRARQLIAILSTALGIATWSSPAKAVEYGIFVDIDTEEELNDLLLTQQINDTTYENLVELLRQGVDLNEASREGLYALPNLTYDEVDRILAYREDAGRIGDPADLVVAGVLSRRKLAALAAFLLVPGPEGQRGTVHGFVRYRMTYVAGDRRVPPMALQGRLSALGGLTVGGAALLDPRRLGPAAWDPNREALLADPDAPRPHVPKLYAKWETPRWGVIAGTYRIGFGQRLTFDNSRRYTPNGFYLDDTIIARYDLSRLCSEAAGEQVDDPCLDSDPRVAPNFQVFEGLRGVAAGAKQLPMPVGWLQIYAFWSMQNYDLYQYRVYDAGACSDPNDDDVECRAPPIYAARDDPAAQTTQYVQRNLPNVVDVITQGTNVAWFRDERTHVGLTGYGSVPRWRVEGVDLDFAPAERLPRAGPFGAVGADFSWGYRWADLFGEISRSFDGIPTSQQGGGGFAGILRHTASWNSNEIELSARYYDQRYANPYSRPIASRDRHQGNTGRDELGGRVRYAGAPTERVDLRAFADVWVRQTTRTPRMRIFARTDVEATRWWKPGLWLEYQSRDLRQSSFRQCTEAETIDEILAMDNTSALICGGQRVQITARSRIQPIKRLYFTLQYRHEVQNWRFPQAELSREIDLDGNSEQDLRDFGNIAGRVDGVERIDELNDLRQDVNAFLMIVAKPVDPLRLRARVRWFWEDITDNARFEHSVWSYLEAQYKIRDWAIPKIRYDLYYYLDRRDSTLTRRPNPEHWIRVQFESRF
ncbi:MAG: hypothetical protein AAGF11_23400 [Myxococcota bacterium]